MHVYIINWRVVHRQYLCNTYCLHIISFLVETSVPLVHETMGTVSEESLGLRAEPFNGFSDLIVVCEPASLQCFFLVARTHGNRRATGRGCRWGDGELPVGSAAADLYKLDYCALSLFGGIHGRSLTVISLLFQSPTHCRYQAYTKFLLTYTAIYRRNSKVLPLGITTLQPQSHFHLGIPYIQSVTGGTDQTSGECSLC